jgi:hypothetical protein
VTLEGIAAARDDSGLPTPSGHRHWHAMQVARLLKRSSDATFDAAPKPPLA